MNPCRETYGGTGPFSEPETAAIRKFITSKKISFSLGNLFIDVMNLRFVQK